jgi:3-phenylpropionate/cinnamic acid dioxygenase small subunit
MSTDLARPGRVGAELYHEIAAFLYREARLLDQERFDEWLDLLTSDVRYWMPTREVVQGRQHDHVDDDEPGLQFAIFNETRKSLAMRVRRIDTGLAHVEEPPSITQRLITNVEVMPADDSREVIARSNFMVHQSRRDNMGATFVGSRKDVLRDEDGRWKIARRRIQVIHVTLPRMLSIFL